MRDDFMTRLLVAMAERSLNWRKVSIEFSTFHSPSTYQPRKRPGYLTLAGKRRLDLRLLHQHHLQLGGWIAGGVLGVAGRGRLRQDVAGECQQERGERKDRPRDGSKS